MDPGISFANRAPARQLRGLIDRYEGYRVSGLPRGIYRGMPSSHLTFIVSIGLPIVVLAQTNPAQRPDRYRCVLGGLQASTALIESGGNEEGVAIALTPLGSRALFAIPAGELWDLSFESVDVLGTAGDQLWERLQDAQSWRARFDACDEVLLRLMSERTVARELAACWHGIVRSGGTLQVGQLAKLTGYSRQHLTRLFTAEFGLGPKLMCRVVRFERAQQMLRSRLSLASIADVAAQCGFADQAHLTREFVRLAGCTPRDLIAQDIPILQEPVTVPGSSLRYDAST